MPFVWVEAKGNLHFHVHIRRFQYLDGLIFYTVQVYTSSLHVLITMYARILVDFFPVRVHRSPFFFAVVGRCVYLINRQRNNLFVACGT